jgi:uncharacterized membrane protein YczE
MKRLTKKLGRSMGLALRLIHINIGLVLYGFSIALMLNAGVGLGPWDVLHEGLSLVLPITIGWAMIGAGLFVLLLTPLLGHVKIGLGTLLNMTLIGLWTDAFLAQPWFPEPQMYAVGLVVFIVGLALNGLATGLYITAGLGAGPRDGFALALAQRLGRSVRVARTGVEITVLITGMLLGGTAGLGTVIFALLIGPFMQTGLRLLAGLQRYHDARAARLT